MTAPGSCWIWAVGIAGRTQRCAGRPETGTRPGAGSRAVSHAGRPAPYPVLVQRRPHEARQLVQVPPHAGARPRLPDRRRPRRHLHVLPPGRHRHPGQPGPAASADGTIEDCHDADITPEHDHPALVRRTARPGLRHPRLLRQRPGPSRSGKPAATKQASPRPGTAYRSSNPKAGPTGSASTTPNTRPSLRRE